MTAPKSFTDPASYSLNSDSIPQISYINGMWVASSWTASPIKVLYASDPTGTWTQVNLPAPPSGYSQIPVGAPFYTGGKYYIGASLQPTPGTYLHRFYEATSLGGTWTEIDTGLGGDYRFANCKYINGEFVFMGYTRDVPLFYNLPWAIASCSTPNGTWTESFGPSSDTPPLYTDDTVTDIVYDSGTYYRLQTQRGTYYDTPAYALYAYIETATSLGGTWSPLHTVPVQAAVISPSLFNDVSGQLFKMGDDFTVPALDALHLYSDATSSWSTATFPTGMARADYVVYADPWYVVGGTTSGSSGAVAYGQSLTSLTIATETFTYTGSPTSRRWGRVMTGAYGGKYFVVGSAHGQFNYAVGTLDTPATYLRQRQSPVRTPSRVRGVDLRQRQTARIT